MILFKSEGSPAARDIVATDAGSIAGCVTLDRTRQECRFKREGRRRGFRVQVVPVLRFVNEEAGRLIETLRRHSFSGVILT